MTRAGGRRYVSFYWRIAISFVLLVILVLAGQGLMFSYLLSRSNDPFGPGNPSAMATVIASDLGARLSRGTLENLSESFEQAVAGVRRGVYVVMRDGREFANSDQPMRPETRAQIVAMLAGSAPVPGPVGPAAGPIVTAPIQVRGELVGLVVLPPPPPRGMFADVAELLSLPGTLILLLVSALAAMVIFAPARRRLRALEEATDRLGRGDLETRAPEDGQDEIARVAASFNRMAEELAARSRALDVSNSLRRQMLADVSHELRTPLTAMRGYLDTLELKELSLDADTRRRYLDIVRSETQRLERIVEDLLDLARHENAASTLDERVFAIERVFAHVASRHEHEAAERGVAIRTHVAADTDQVSGDPDRIEQVMSNLVANALRHTPAGGTIDLRAAIEQGSFTLSVTDSGSGIAAEHVPHVFDRFYKVDSARTGGAGGSGLGLSIAKAIVERHGGTIRVSSRPGETMFRVTLPVGVANVPRV